MERAVSLITLIILHSVQDEFALKNKPRITLISQILMERDVSLITLIILHPVQDEFALKK